MSFSRWLFFLFIGKQAIPVMHLKEGRSTCRLSFKSFLILYLCADFIWFLIFVNSLFKEFTNLDHFVLILSLSWLRLRLPIICFWIAIDFLGWFSVRFYATLQSSTNYFIITKVTPYSRLGWTLLLLTLILSNIFCKQLFLYIDCSFCLNRVFSLRRCLDK